MTPAAQLPTVRITRRGARRWRSLHPWIFRDDVVDDAGARAGEIVRVADESGRPLGAAFHSSRSKIALRTITRDERTVDATLWDERVAAALARRAVIAGWEARRLVFGESDGLPGLVADLYGAHLVVQVLTAGAQTMLAEVVDAIAGHVRVDSVLLRNDPSVRSLEGLAREVRPMRGTTPPVVEVDESGVRLSIDPWRGQKTGAFLDQRENRIEARRFARGRVLDAFAHDGAFGLHAALGADEVVVVDASADALARGRENAARNARSNMTFVEANAFDDLRDRDRRGERFDLVMLDPPAFAKSRGDVPAALRGYKELNLRAIRLLAEDGVLVTSSCSYNLREPDFEQVLRDAAADAGRELTVVERRGQAADHPVLLTFPESRYLKCFVLRSVGSTR